MENLSKILNSNRQPLSGQLYKYTNVVKGIYITFLIWVSNCLFILFSFSLQGYQYRYFSVDPEAGILNYYLCENSEESSTVNPRGQVDLNGAIVCPSDEDSRTFTINCANGDMLKLRASDARARQVWIDGLRAVVEGHTQGNVHKIS